MFFPAPSLREEKGVGDELVVRWYGDCPSTNAAFIVLVIGLLEFGAYDLGFFLPVRRLPSALRRVLEARSIPAA